MSKKHRRTKPRSLLTPEDKEAEAIEFIKNNVGDGTAYVCFSGGKDSIVTLDLVKKSGINYLPFYSATGIDPPELVQFIRKEYPYVKFVRPEKTFWQYLLENGPPRQNKRWCCRLLKELTPIDIDVSNIKLVGIRREESNKRASRPRKDFNKKMKQFLLKPIFYWLEWEIWEYIEKNNLPYPSLYDEGFDRIGCVICPFLCRDSNYTFSGYSRTLELHMERWPKLYKTFEKIMMKVYKKGPSTGRYEIDFEEWLDRWYKSKSFRSEEETLDKKVFDIWKI